MESGGEKQTDFDTIHSFHAAHIHIFLHPAYCTTKESNAIITINKCSVQF